MEARRQNYFGRGPDVLIAVARNGEAMVVEIAAELDVPSSNLYRDYVDPLAVEVHAPLHEGTTD